MPRSTYLEILRSRPPYLLAQDDGGAISAPLSGRRTRVIEPSASLFALASCDEIWQRGVRLEIRLEQGEARQTGRSIVATDRAASNLIAMSDAEADPLRVIAATLHDARSRIVTRAISIDGVISTEAVMTVSIAGVAVVTDRAHAAADVALLRAVTGKPVELDRPPALPAVWRNGSASVLFHEAAGHAAEQRCAPLRWPEWLQVLDIARDGTADLARGELPLAVRRESFRDVPLRRMTQVVVRQQAAPYVEPADRIEIQLVSHGTFDPLDERVTLHISVADHVSAVGARRIAPFDIVATRSEVVAAICGATGDPMRYPGVVCSLEGQEVVVGSAAPTLLTSELW